MGIFVCQVWLVPTLSCLNQACAQRLTGNMTQRRAASGRGSAAEERQARERKERASAPTRRDHCAVAGRVGSRRDPKIKRPQTRTFCFSVSAANCSLVPASGSRAALDWKHDGAARCQWQRKRRGGTASKGAEGAGFSPDASRPLRSRRESRSAVHNLRAASLPLASLVVHWAFASLSPALRALRLRLPGSNKQNVR